MSALVFLFAAASTVSGQRRLLTMKEYFDDIKSVDALRLDGPSRWEGTEETLSNGAVIKTLWSMSEVSGPGRTRRYAKSTQGAEVTEIEQISIDSFRYQRQDGGSWTKTDMRQLRNGNGSGSGSPRVTSQCSQVSVEPSSLDGKPMRLYEMESVESKDNELTFRHSRSWIGEDGRLYKREDTSGKLSPREETRRSTMITTYDPPDIKAIEAPIE